MYTNFRIKIAYPPYNTNTILLVHMSCFKIHVHIISKSLFKQPEKEKFQLNDQNEENEQVVSQ
jgi:hypothetical protein